MTNTTLSAAPGRGVDASPWRTALWVLWIVLMVAGVTGLIQRLMYGHSLSGYGSYVPWGLWIGLYFLGIGIAGGAFIIGALGFILGVPGFSNRAELRTAIVLSVAAMIPAFIGVDLDLGHMERLYRVLSAPAFTSMIAFNAWMYNIFLLVALATWLLSLKKESVWLKPLLIFGGILAVLFPSQSGVFFEAVRINEFWHSPILSVLFLSSAIALGAAGLLLVRSLYGAESTSLRDVEDYDSARRWLRIISVVAIVVYLMFEFAEFSIVFWNPGPHSPNVEFLLFGDYWAVFWILHILFGVLIPVMFFTSSQKWLWNFAAFLVVVGFAAARMCVLIPGQITGQIPGLQAAFQDARLTYSYHPTTMEYLVALFMLALGIMIYYLGMRLGEVLASRTDRR
jgi:protein NrfD